MPNEEYNQPTQPKLTNSLNKLSITPSVRAIEDIRVDRQTTLSTTSSDIVSSTTPTTSDATKVSNADGKLYKKSRRRQGKNRNTTLLEGMPGTQQKSGSISGYSISDTPQRCENQQQQLGHKHIEKSTKKHRNRNKKIIQPITSADNNANTKNNQVASEQRKKKLRWDKNSMQRCGFQPHLTQSPDAAESGEVAPNGSSADATETSQDPKKGDGESRSSSRRRRRPNRSSTANSPTELTLTLIEQLNTNEYECMICWENLGNGKDYEFRNLDNEHDTSNSKGKKPIKNKPGRRQGIWSCETCYAMFHLQCVRDWSTKSQKDKETQSSDSREASKGWRCPACQNVNQKYIPSQYRCFCGSVQNPTYSSSNTPHSCGRVCRKYRKGSSCPHRCTLLCHPGPCPPCSALAPIHSCYCGKKPLQFRCGQQTDSLSCGSTCGKLLNCGKHHCSAICHKGPCQPCTEILEVTCTCGKDNRFAPCGSEVAQISYTCSQTCEKVLECGEHICLSKCHFGECSKDTCPLLPSNVSSCPCHKTALNELRTKCTDPVPSCGKICGKLLTCGHKCKLICHLGPCQNCDELVSRPCVCQTSMIDGRCTGISTYPDDFSRVGLLNDVKNILGVRNQISSEDSNQKIFTCHAVCHRTLSCGRHKCEQKCCKYNSPNISKRDKDIIHTCPRVCGRKLNCGKHTCQLPCHPGKCHVCLEASFEDLTCYCGNTVVPAPIRCGTKLPACPNPCTRPRDCGHPPNLMHSCHFEDDKCPPCCFLVSRSCRCGSNMIRNIPCYKAANPDQFLAPSCGTPCSKILKCGHRCSRVCHSDECETVKCQAKCGKPRKNCRHTCDTLCHEGAPCPEEPCSVNVTKTCPCGRLKKLEPCGLYAIAIGESEGMNGPAPIDLTCNNECRLYQRNKILAEALNITPKDNPLEDVYYTELLVNFTRSNSQFIKKLEETLRDFVNNPNKKILHLPPMKAIQRAVVHEVAKFYQIDSESVDAEPKRSVILHKNSMHSKIPEPLISEYVAQGGGVNVPNEESDEVVEYNAIEIRGLDDDLDTDNLDELLKLVIGHGPNQYEYRWLSDKDVAIVVADTTGEVGDVERKVLKAVEQLQLELATLATSVAPRTAPTRSYRKTKHPQIVYLHDSVTPSRSSNIFDALELSNP